MSNQEMVFTLFSSDSTVRYIKDIFSVLSLPRGSEFQFRYQNEYIDPRVKPHFSNQSKINQKALIAFRSKSKTLEEERFYVPIRWVTIRSTEKISNGYVVNFEIGGYPRFVENYRSNTVTFEGLNKFAKEAFNQPQYNTWAVWGEQLITVEQDDNKKDRDSENWYDIVKRLTLIPQYKDYHFFKCSIPYTETVNGDYISSKVNCEKAGNYLSLVEGKCINIDIEYYSENYDKDKKREICILVDENVISIARGLRTMLQSRYGNTKLSLQPKKVPNKTISEIIVYSSSSEASELETEIIFPVVVVKNQVYRIIKSVVTAFGGALIAIPGITNNNFDIRVNVLIAGLGALVLGINSYWEAKEE